MLYIEKSEHIEAAKDNHLQKVKCRVIKKLSGKKCNEDNCRICNSTNQKSDFNCQDYLIQFLIDDKNLENVLIGSPEVILKLQKILFVSVLGIKYKSKIKKYCSLPKISRNTIQDVYYLFQDLKTLFNYDNWFVSQEPNEYGAYQLAKALNRRTCTYCNRTYTDTLESKTGGKLMRPQFDHWFPKEKYPLLALSFYNLIPSCSICNSSSKGREELNLKDYVHPYLDVTQTDDFQFNYEYFGGIDKFNVFVEPTTGSDNSKRIVNTIEKLKVDTMYNAHHSELSDLIRTKEAYSDSYIEKMQQFFPDSHLSKEEVFRLLFGTELDSKDFHKRPLSKFKHDILKGLGII